MPLDAPPPAHPLHLEVQAAPTDIGVRADADGEPLIVLDPVDIHLLDRRTRPDGPFHTVGLDVLLDSPTVARGTDPT
jgi:hypothetical protein